MQLTGLESILVGSFIALCSGVATSVFKGWKEDEHFVPRKENDRQIKSCLDRFDRGTKQMDKTSLELSKLAKRFEKFVIYGNLESDVKDKILGDGV